jgi:hypothetical protein
MVLHPFAEVRLGMLMPIVISGTQFMMNFEQDPEWRKKDERKRQGDAEPKRKDRSLRKISHRGGTVP